MYLHARICRESFYTHTTCNPNEGRLNARRLPIQVFSKVFGDIVADIRMHALVECREITKICVFHLKEVSLPAVYTRATALEELRSAP